MSEHSDIINTAQRINQAVELSRSVRLTARMLLDLIDQHGYIRLEYDAALHATGLDEVGTLRGHLSQLKSAGILALYHLNGAVDITFAGFPTRALSAEMIAGRALARARSADADPIDLRSASETPQQTDERAPGAREVPIFVQQRAEGARRKENLQDDLYISHAPAPALVGWLVDITPSPLGSEPTNQPALDSDNTESPEPKTSPAINSPLLPNVVEQALSYSLLLAVRMIPANAKRLSQTFRFATIREAVAWWDQNRQSNGGRFEDTPGIVVRWLDAPEKFAVPRLNPAWLQSEFGRRWRTKAEIEADRIAQEREEEARRQLMAEIEAEEKAWHLPTKDDPPIANSTWQEYWPQVMEKLKVSVPASTFNTWVLDTQPLGWEDDVLLINTPNTYAQQWLQSRLRPMIKRMLAQTTGQAIDIRFVVNTLSRPEDT